MSILITVVGSNQESDEYQAALKLKKIILDGMPKDAIGEIVLFSSATFIGQAVKDVDLLIIGTLKNYTERFCFYDDNGKYVRDFVDIQSFFTTIEIKSHSIDKISRIGTDFYVKYGEKSHCVTEQSNLQKISAFNFYNRMLGYAPFVTNVIWFTQAEKKDIKELLSVSGREMQGNVLGHNFSFEELMQLLIWQRKPYFAKGIYKFDSISGRCTTETLIKSMKVFSEAKEKMGDLTRKRIEQITNKFLEGNSFIESKGKLSIYRGRAGTGKTVGLLRTAIKLVEEKQCRALILTYNKALVSDIRRLFALAELPDIFEINCVAINTMQSYFFRFANQILYNGKLNGEDYLIRYNEILKEFIDFFSMDDAVSYVRELCNKDCQLNWDYVLIDEAQDWTTLERDLIIKLFNKENIIIADGGQQFVRNIDACDWSLIKDRNNIKFKYCLRQKNNIVNFINHFSTTLDVNSSKIITHDNLVGGKIIIIENKNRLFEIHREEMKKLIAAGNIAYDMLYLVPYTMIKKGNNGNCFSKKGEFENNGIFLWDGTNEGNRDNYSTQADEIRVIQYDSARGLEGWTVCCLEFDVFWENKERQFDTRKDNNILLLESTEERLKKFLLNWALIPMTRAIDTLIITLDNVESKTGQLLKKLSEECRDYVTWIS